ncbi:MAG: class I SAM-dependent methyltransferase [Patescibacteria group bacterium]
MNYQIWTKYESAERWASYYTQVDEVLKFNPQTCLEIGVGNGIVTQTLKNNGVHITTLDLDSNLKPDLVGSVEAIPMTDDQYDVVLCAEVLEHLPFSKLEICLSEIARITKLGAVLSVPHWGYSLRLILDMPILPKVRFVCKLPIKSMLPLGGEHQWELGRIGVNIKDVKAAMSKDFKVEKDWLLPWNSYHHFFRLKKA